MSVVGTISYGNLTDLALGTKSPYTPGEGVIGLLDEADIYDRALLQAEIQAIYDAGSAGKCKPSSITLDARVHRHGGKRLVELTWSPADGGSVYMLRDGIVVQTTDDDGETQDRLGSSYRDLCLSGL